MSRQIKFRCWDGERIFIPSIIPNDRPSTDHLGGVVMQFTGFVDKNGKEIYEGDLVKDAVGQVNPITFAAGTYWFNWLHLIDALEPFEVVGNIYEVKP